MTQGGAADQIRRTPRSTRAVLSRSMLRGGLSLNARQRTRDVFRRRPLGKV